MIPVPMILNRIAPWRLGLLLPMIVLAACRDDTPTIRPPVELSADLRAQLEIAPLELSEGRGTEVTIRVLPGGGVEPVASFTAQVRYDVSQWEFMDNDDGGNAMLAVNPSTPGLIRLAGTHISGFTDGTLARLRFKAKGEGTATDPVLTFTELHATDGEDLRRVTIGVPLLVAGRSR